MCIQYLTHGSPSSRYACGLGDLVDVVQLAVVDAAGVQVEVLAEQLHRHHRALQVPAGRAPAPRGVPAHDAADAGLLGPPEGEVGLVPAPLDLLDPGGLALAGDVHQREGAVAGRLGRVEVQARRDLVGDAALRTAGWRTRSSARRTRWRAGSGRPAGCSAPPCRRRTRGCRSRRCPPPSGASRAAATSSLSSPVSESATAWPTSVMLMTCRTGICFQRSARRRVSANTYARMLPRCGK